MNSNNPVLEEAQWQRTAARLFLFFAILTIAGLICFLFDPLSGFLLWIMGLGGGILTAVLIDKARQTAFRCRSCASIFLQPSLVHQILYLPADEAIVHCPSCRRKQPAFRMIVVES